MLVGGVFVFGIGVGVAADPAPTVHKSGTHTEFIKVPEYKTRVVEKKVQLPPPPLPESCRDAAKLLPAVIAESDIQTNAAGKILLALSDLGRGSLDPDIHLINQATATIRNQKDRLGSAVIHSHQALEDFNTSLEQCNTDLGELQ